MYRFLCWSELPGKESYLLLRQEFPGEASSIPCSLGLSGRLRKGPLEDDPVRVEILCCDPMDGCVAQDITILQVALGFFVLPFPTSPVCSSALALLLKITRGPLEVFARSPRKSGHQVNYFLLLLLVMFEMNAHLHMGRRPLLAVLISWAYSTHLGGSQQPAWQWGPIYVNKHNSLFSICSRGLEVLILTFRVFLSWGRRSLDRRGGSRRKPKADHLKMIVAASGVCIFRHRDF